MNNTHLLVIPFSSSSFKSYFDSVSFIVKTSFEIFFFLELDFNNPL